MKLSVVVTTYNRAEPLSWTLDSLTRQTLQPDELIVCDNCSEDETETVVKSFQGKFKKLIYHRNATNIGMPGHLNKGIKKAAGEYIANLHDADTFEPDLLEKWAKALDDFPKSGFVFCGINSCGSDPSRSKIFLHDVAPYTEGKEFFKQHFLYKQGSLVRGTVMARSSAYKNLGLFDECWGIEADVDMWMRMCSKYGVAYVREPLQICSNDHLSRSEKMHFLNFYAQLDVNLDKVLSNDEESLRNVRSRIRAIRRKRFLYLSASQIKRRNFFTAFHLFKWAWSRQLNYLKNPAN